MQQAMSEKVVIGLSDKKTAKMVEDMPRAYEKDARSRERSKAGEQEDEQEDVARGALDEEAEEKEIKAKADILLKAIGDVGKSDDENGEVEEGEDEEADVYDDDGDDEEDDDENDEDDEDNVHGDSEEDDEKQVEA